jgi:ATP-binding cassette subfamily B protein
VKKESRFRGKAESDYCPNNLERLAFINPHDSTSSVDTETEALSEMHSGLTRNGPRLLLLIVQSVMNADLILVMDKGKIIQKGTHGELVAQDGMYRKIYDLQTRIDEELAMEISQSV